MLFGNPEKAAPWLSPDGTRIAYLAPHEGTLSVWVRTIGADDDRLVASDPHRPIRNAFWTPDGTRVLYLQDARGDENFHLFAADPDGGAEPVDLTPYEGTLVQLQSLDLDRPDVILIAMNRRDPQLFDVYRLDPRTGEATLDTENPGAVSEFADDADFIVRAGVIQHPDASCEIVVRDDAGAPWRTLARFDVADGTPELAGFTPDGAALLATTSADANAARLVRFDLATGERTDVVGDPEYDVAEVVFSPRTKAPVAASVVRERVGWTVLDAAYADDFAALAAQVPGDLGIASTDRDDRVWLVSSIVDAGSRSFWSYDRGTRRAKKIFAMRPALERYTLASMTPIRYPARDGLTIHGYLEHAAGPSGARPARRAAGPRRPVGARHVGLQPVRAVADESRLRGAAAELSRFGRVRQSALERRRPRVGRRDAHRPARRERVAGRARRSPIRLASRSWAARTAVTRRSPRSRSRPTRSPAASTSSDRPT